MSDPSSKRPTSSLKAPLTDFQLPKIEEEILALCGRRQKTVQKSLTPSGRQAFVFYDGPPFATGLPHYGHLLAGTIKDIVPRYWTMHGRDVERRFGWDCHGLPIESLTESELGLHGKAEIEALRRPQLQRRLPRERAALHRGVASAPSRAWAAGSTSRTTTRPWTRASWRPCGGSSSSCGTRA